MQIGRQGTLNVEAQLASGFATAEVVHYSFFQPPDSQLQGAHSFRIELSLSPRHRSARGSFADFWGQHRFERIGDLFILPPEMRLRTRCDEQSPLSAIVCELEQSAVMQLFDNLPELSELHLSASLDIRDSRLKSLMLRIGEETRQPGFASELMLELMSGQLAVELIRHGNAIAERVERGGLGTRQLRLIEERLQSDCRAPTLQELADLCTISVRHLARGFRASKGITIGAYVANSQIAHAKRLLASDVTVSTIADRLGFSSSANFCASFRRSTGLTPGQYRARML